MRKTTNKNKSISRVLTAIALAITLNACELSSQNTRRGAAYDITAPAIESSSFYMQKADTEPTAQTDWYLLAAKAFIKENRLTEASNLVLTLAKMPLLDVQIAEWQLIRAEILLLRNNPKSAIDNLKFEPSWRLPQIQWQRYFTMQYGSYLKVDDKKNAIISLVNLEPYVIAGQEQKLSDQTWSILSRLTPSEIEQLSAVRNDRIQAWLELLDKLTKANTLGKKEAVVAAWAEENDDMLASRFLPVKLLELESLDIGKPSNIGIMLPLSKKFALQGETIRNGIMQALINDRSSDVKPNFNFYDTNKMSVKAIMDDMKAKSVQFVIGPLQKNKVQEFIGLNQGSFRHLAMNIPSGDYLNRGSCFFTLSPEQEAQQAAVRMSKRHRYPIMIAPSGDLGRRVGRAFQTQWQGLTGRKASIEYFTNSAGMAKAVARAMGVTQSESRTKQLNQILGINLTTETRGRQDIDAVYLVAGSGELTLLKPFIEVSVNPGQKLPKLYASSRSNNQARGVPNVTELNGIEFSDVPLLVKPDSTEARKFQQLWPDMNNNMIRLYSLGLDAYALIDLIPKMQSNAKYRYKGESGTLSLATPCVINRTMPWAVYTSSGVRAIE